MGEPHPPPSGDVHDRADVAVTPSPAPGTPQLAIVLPIATDWHLESLPASWTVHDGSLRLASRKTDHRHSLPRRFVLDLPLDFVVRPGVHPAPEFTALTVPLPVQLADSGDLLEDYHLVILFRILYDSLRYAVKDLSYPLSSSPPMLRGYPLPDSHIVTVERLYDAPRVICNLHNGVHVVKSHLLIVTDS